RWRTHADGDAVPGVDGGDDPRQVDHFLLAEVRLDLLVNLIVGVRVGDAGQGLGPLQGGAFTVAVVRALAPGVQAVDALRRLAAGEQVLGVHVDAVGAAVDLAGAQLHQ